ncbi:MAG TPA: hypothetical protein VNU97_14080 [Rhizomicrobium sp.]|jgi:hypothetical protein|nr:hypothetical protein [Rhizomicrobium sp.]
MAKRVATVVLGAFLAVAGSQALAAGGPPGWTPPPLDPCGHKLCPKPEDKPKLCRTVTTHDCVEPQGSHCKRYQNHTQTVCS